ncbi:MAG: RnfABCDGE type electron transport complex subunit G [Pseudomonadota bacterium]
MPDYFKFPFVLILVCVIAALSLAGIYTLTSPHKEAMEADQITSSLKVVFPEASEFKEIKSPETDFAYRLAKNSTGNVIGYVVDGSAIGYSSVIRVMVGLDEKFAVQGIKVISQKETPGLGDKIEEVKSSKTIFGMIFGKNPDEAGLKPWFQTQFVGLTAPVKVDKDGGRVESITGATISSRAVCNAVNDAIAKLKRELKVSKE